MKKAGLQIGDVVVYADRRDEYRGLVVAHGNLIQHGSYAKGKLRVYWGRGDVLTWELPDDLLRAQ